MADGKEKVAELEGQVTDLEKQIEEMAKQLQDAAAGQPDLAQALELQGQIDELVAKSQEQADALKKMQDERDAAKAELDLIAKATEEEREYCKDMKPEEKKSFFGKSPEDRKAEMGKRAENDEIVKVGDTVIRKSAVGEAQFAVIKSQQDQIAKTEKALQDERTKRETAELTKRADDSYPHVPGSTAERAQMLGAIDKMDEPLRKAFNAVLEQSEKLGAAAFQKLGSAGGGKDPISEATRKAAADFDSQVAQIRKRDNLSRTDAMSKVRKTNPELFKAYQEVEGQAN